MGRTVADGEPLWTAQDRDIATAWFAYQDSLCGQCGLPRSVCHDPDVIHEWEADVEHCHVTAIQQRRMKRHRDQAGPDVVVDLDGVHTVARRRQR